MTKEQVNSILMAYKDKLPKESLISLKERLENAPEEIYDNLMLAPVKNPIIMLVLSIFLGAFGVDRFILGDIGLGICKLIFGWLTFGIWPLLDIYFCYKKTLDKNLEAIEQLI